MGEETKNLPNTPEDHTEAFSHQSPEVLSGFELLDRVEEAAPLVVRDDQYEFPWLEEAVKKTRKRGTRFSLIDTGFLPQEKIEWLAEAGADIYSSDEADRELLQLEFIQLACRRSKSILAYFYRGALEAHEGTAEAQNLSNLAARGAFLHLADREPEEMSVVAQWSLGCRRAGSCLVYYHRGPLESNLVSLAETGAWLHLSSRQVVDESNENFLLELVKLAQKRGGNVVLYLEKELSPIFLHDFLQAEGFLVFPRQIYDYRSPYRPLQDKGNRRQLDWRAYFLYPRLWR